MLSPIRTRNLPLDHEPHSLKMLGNDIAIASEHIILLATNRLDDDNFTEIRSEKRAIVALEFMQNNLFCLTEDRLLLRVNRTSPHFSSSLLSSPLFHPSKAIALTHKHISVAEVLSDGTIVWFERGVSRNYETISVDSDHFFNERSNIIIAYDETCSRLLYFNGTKQIASVWRLEEPRYALATLQFPSDEVTVDAIWFGPHLYTLTHDGMLSKWELLANGRKLRSKLWSTGLKHCIKICLLDAMADNQVGQSCYFIKLLHYNYRSNSCVKGGEWSAMTFA
uniref:Uncharacterized protein n=1 Tax=Plectus sambesii TaxID=2011161 RepID=A0A914UPY1_9BILA